MASAAHPVAMLALDAVTMLFWFAGFIALAVLHHRVEEVYFQDRVGNVYKGCAVAGGFCGEIAAAVVFGALEWWVSPVFFFLCLSCRARAVVADSFSAILGPSSSLQRRC